MIGQLNAPTRPEEHEEEEKLNLVIRTEEVLLLISLI